MSRPFRKELISVCICTFKRPRLLSDLLKKLSSQETAGLFALSAVIVDNDVLRSAEAIVTSLAGRSSFSIAYHAEPIQNISLARNRAVQNAGGDYLAFIDDDEIPHDRWLLGLYETLRRYHADGVLGPVLPVFQVPPPKWVLTGKLFERPRYRTGDRIPWRMGRTGNVLYQKGVFSETGELFDPKFGSGGEDLDLSRRIVQKGCVLRWCDEAPVYETIPPARWKRATLLKRALLRGKMAIQHPGGRQARLVKAFTAIPVYALALPVLAILGHHLFMEYLIKIFDHLGSLLSLLGIDLLKQKYVLG
jgi:succinoglycan biosynthesis protein ExoM